MTMIIMYSAIKQKFKDLENRLSDAAVISDPKKLKEISRQYNGLKEMIGLILKLEKKQIQLSQNEEMIKYESDIELVKIAKEEILGLKRQSEELTNQIEAELHPADPNDKKNVIMEIRAGAGGDESALFAAELKIRRTAGRQTGNPLNQPHRHRRLQRNYFLHRRPAYLWRPEI